MPGLQKQGRGPTLIVAGTLRVPAAGSALMGRRHARAGCRERFLVNGS
jgi:hypothetical protein